MDINKHFINNFNAHYNFLGSVYYWQILMCVSRYIIPETRYMPATSVLEIKLSYAFK